MKPVRLSAHAAAQLQARGGTVNEVVDAIGNHEWAPAELGRLEVRMNLSYEAEWNGKWYSTKQVRPIFVEESSEIVVVTVYVYYF